MKTYLSLFLIAVILLCSCSSAKSTSNDRLSLDTELREKNRANISLLQRIRQKPGIVLQNNVPILNKTTNSFDSGGNQEPLYVLNNQVIGNSFHSVNELIDSYNIKKIKILSGADAAGYGSQGANGVIKITSY
ncbi:TonB-dependent receptor-like protein [Maribacter caenipelagi]|uniref:TonB-dependent receptor-like protein n=1 Tax=Maribacter caenipelagi TaxID=1447781 RepID=A0A4R7DD28_9FLAO|nr:TonB-dependent receptor plug domain-containing protein [Maribacter caenipelagi]TDS18867.1 TonB-dependent receptor-like protein [Maribacter caenipelagi]|tara:strand:- start:680 stop:1078 length:399 start_codon:yes stop_codon:yes gene_type:complete